MNDTLEEHEKILRCDNIKISKDAKFDETNETDYTTYEDMLRE